MRIVLITLLVLVLGVVAYFGWVGAVGAPSRHREKGIAAAEEDIASGRPSIRCVFASVDLGVPHLTVEGLGIDRATGLPLYNTWYWCGTGRDYEAEATEDAAYNEHIRAAHAAGKLERFRLDHKLRTRDAIDAVFAAAAPVRVAADGDAIVVAGGLYRLVFYANEGYPCADIVARAGEPRRVRFSYMTDPCSTHPTRGGRHVWATGPFDGVLADDDTSVILRDSSGGLWTVDLPRGIVVQHAAPP